LAAPSRSHETEADELGCKLAAIACYDTGLGSKVIYNMQENDKKHGASGNDLMWSHPALIERYEFLKALNLDENLAKYSHCHNLQRR
jgi:Zn-dependent protease with chaperone function